MTPQISPLILRGIREASDAIEKALADPNRTRLFKEFRAALIASNPYPTDDEMHHPWHSAMATQLVAVRFGTWKPFRA